MTPQQKKMFELEDLKEELTPFKTRLHQLAIHLQLIKDKECILFRFEENNDNYILRKSTSTFSILCIPKDKNEIGNLNYTIVKKLIELNYNVI